MVLSSHQTLPVMFLITVVFKATMINGQKYSVFVIIESKILLESYLNEVWSLLHFDPDERHKLKALVYNTDFLLTTSVAAVFDVLISYHFLCLWEEGEVVPESSTLVKNLGSKDPLILMDWDRFFQIPASVDSLCLWSVCERHKLQTTREQQVKNSGKVLVEISSFYLSWYLSIMLNYQTLGRA